MTAFKVMVVKTKFIVAKYDQRLLILSPDMNIAKYVCMRNINKKLIQTSTQRKKNFFSPRGNVQLY